MKSYSFFKYKFTLLLISVLCFYNSLGVCQEGSYKDVLTQESINLEGDAGKTQLVLRLFWYYSAGLKPAENLEVARKIKLEYDENNWQGFVKLINIIILPEEQLQETKKEIEQWARENLNQVNNLIVPESDRLVREIVGDQALPLLDIRLFLRDGKEWKKTTKANFEGLSEIYTEYFELGKTLLKRANQDRDYREIPIIPEEPEDLTTSEAKDMINIAIGAFEALKKNVGENAAEVYNDIGTSYYRQREYNNALPNFKEAVRLDDLEPVYKRNLAMTYGRLMEEEKNYEEKKNYLRKMNEILGKMPDVEKENVKKIQKIFKLPDPARWILTTGLVVEITASGALLGDLPSSFTRDIKLEKEISEELTRAKENSPTEDKRELTTTELAEQQQGWERYMQLKDYKKMQYLTAGNLAINCVPIALREANWMPLSSKDMSLIYLGKSVVLALVAGSFRNDANQNKEEADKNNIKKDMKLLHLGQYQESKEIEKWLWINAGIDLLTAGAWGLHYYLSDKVPAGEKDTDGAYNLSPLPIGLNVRFDGDENQVIMFCRRRF